MRVGGLRRNVAARDTRLLIESLLGRIPELVLPPIRVALGLPEPIGQIAHRVVIDRWSCFVAGHGSLSSLGFTRSYKRASRHEGSLGQRFAVGILSRIKPLRGHRRGGPATPPTCRRFRAT